MARTVIALAGASRWCDRRHEGATPPLVVGDAVCHAPGTAGLRQPRARPLRLEQLYRIRFTYPESWVVGLEGGWQQHLFLAEGRCEGYVTGRFRGANFPQRRTAAGPFRPDFRAVIETDDGAREDALALSRGLSG